MTQALFRPVDPRQPEIRVTQRDVSEIERALASDARWDWRSVDFLARELMRATVVDEGTIPANVVTVGSEVEYREEGQDSPRVVVLALPDEPARLHNAVSVLAPIGTALLGLTAGQSICFADRDGRPVTITVVRVTPRAEADQRRPARRRANPRSGRERPVSQDR